MYYSTIETDLFDLLHTIPIWKSFVPELKTSDIHQSKLLLPDRKLHSIYKNHADLIQRNQSDFHFSSSAIHTGQYRFLSIERAAIPSEGFDCVRPDLHLA